MTLADKLNDYGVNFLTGKEGLRLEVAPEDSDVLVDAELDHFTDKLDNGDVLVYVDYDPRDRRCGLVVYVEFEGEVAWYDENGDCCWVETRLS